MGSIVSERRIDVVIHVWCQNSGSANFTRREIYVGIVQNDLHNSHFRLASLASHISELKFPLGGRHGIELCQSNCVNQKHTKTGRFSYTYSHTPTTMAMMKKSIHI